MKRKFPDPCPCGLPRSYADCCGRLHAGEPAVDAEALMRSRYSAYARGLEAYLLATWHATTRPATLNLADGQQPRWIGLEVKASATAGDEASVDFVALCRIGGRARRMAEHSRFRREQGRWYYLDGVTG